MKKKLRVINVSNRAITLDLPDDWRDGDSNIQLYGKIEVTLPDPKPKPAGIWFGPGP